MSIFYVEVASVYCGCKSVMNHLPPGIVFSFALFTKSAYLMHISKVKFLFVVYCVRILGQLSFVKQGFHYVDFVCLIHV